MSNEVRTAYISVVTNLVDKKHQARLKTLNVAELCVLSSLQKGALHLFATSYVLTHLSVLPEIGALKCSACNRLSTVYTYLNICMHAFNSTISIPTLLYDRRPP